MPSESFNFLNEEGGERGCVETRKEKLGNSYQSGKMKRPGTLCDDWLY